MSRSLRTAVSAVLIALACLLVPFGTLAVWAVHGLGDTGRYVTTMAPLASEPAVRDAVADTVGDDLAQASGMDRDLVRDAVRSFTGTPAFHAAWDAGNTAAHTAVLRALRADGERADGERAATLDLAAVTAPLRDRLAADHVPFADRFPVEHREVVLVPPDELPALRKGYHVLDIASFWLPAAAVLFAVTGIAVAACRRRALTATALGTALGGAFLALAIAIGRHLTLTDLPDPSHRAVTAAVYDTLTSPLRTASWLLLTLGLTTAAATSLLSHLSARHPRPATPPIPATPPPEPTRVHA
ncbi:hypothetical protein [Streptomyces sp. Amel2xC10]|uniref:hypothetical protein n=1 Tax=Streptomyces sp. Amel2xC10 TaxID=1305826 RepID=UPI000A083462|nr:hypothetical protein [Streptomyces sp. Amel2xC10]SMF62121.1 hypothetical protein SAMN02745830_04777 [Streptomyces sp. Amel2xC10]